MYNMHLSSVSFGAFVPTIMSTLGYSTTVTLVITFPPYFLAAIVGIWQSWSSGRFNERTWHITGFKLIIIVGFILAVATTNIPARFVAIFLFVPFSYGINNIILGWIASTLGQTDEKKAVALALCNTFGNLSAIYTPYLWPDSDAPVFLKAMTSSIAFSLGVIACAWAMRWILQRANKKIREQNPDATNFYVY